jgi:two-component system phosphate regulon sensor histidine kinase PhoR
VAPAASAPRLGLRARLFLTSLLLLFLCGGLSAIWLESRIRRNFEADLLLRLGEQAELLAQTLDLLPPDRLDAAADQAAALVGTRFSIILQDGSVIGDSQLSPAELRVTEDHSTRPEVIAALRSGRGSARRFSSTIGIDMLYVAVAWPAAGAEGVVRTAVPMTELAAAVRALRRRMLLAGLVGMMVAVLMSGLASHWVSRDLRALLLQAQRIAEPGRRLRLALPSAQGELSGLVGSFNQLAEELEQTVAALADERHRFGAVLEGMADAVIAVDRDRRISLVNPAVIALFQPQRSPLGQPLVSLIRASNVHTIVEAAIQDGLDGAAEFELNLQPPRQLQVSVTTQQRGRGCVLVCRDVTALRRLERMRRDFITNVSHELRTPVTIILANAETLASGALTDPVHGPIFTNAIHRNAERLEHLIDGLLDLSSLESGRYVPSSQPVQLSRIVEQVYGGLRTHAAERDQIIELGVPDDLCVRADPQALEQILTNLTENAIKYSPPGSTIEIGAWPEDEEGWLRLEVTDNGGGISEHHHARIFERFYRVDAGRSKKMGGSGLGLSIVKHLAEAMGCRLGVTSEPPHGTTFWLQLPEAVAELGED